MQIDGGLPRDLFGQPCETEKLKEASALS